MGISAASAQTDGNASSKILTMVGVVKNVSAKSLTVDTGKDEYVVAVDSSTPVVVARGGSQVRDLVYRVPDPNRLLITDLKAGAQVMVKYRQSGSVKTAVEVEVLQRAKK
jgi:hypothetical protein